MKALLPSGSGSSAQNPFRPFRNPFSLYWRGIYLALERRARDDEGSSRTRVSARPLARPSGRPGRGKAGSSWTARLDQQFTIIEGR